MFILFLFVSRHTKKKSTGSIEFCFILGWNISTRRNFYNAKHNYRQNSSTTKIQFSILLKTNTIQIFKKLVYFLGFSVSYYIQIPHLP